MSKQILDIQREFKLPGQVFYLQETQEICEMYEIPKFLDNPMESSTERIEKV